MHLYRARQHPKAFLEVVTMRRRPATRRNKHVEHREAAGGLPTREQHGVSVADNREVDERIVVGTRDRELARWIIGCQGRRGSTCRVVHPVPCWSWREWRGRGRVAPAMARAQAPPGLEEGGRARLFAEGLSCQCEDEAGSDEQCRCGPVDTQCL